MAKVLALIISPHTKTVGIATIFLGGNDALHVISYFVISLKMFMFAKMKVLWQNL